MSYHTNNETGEDLVIVTLAVSSTLVSANNTLLQHFCNYPQKK